jgi:uncharacterized protein (DUF924 family)
MSETDPRARRVVTFWREAGPDAWFRKDTEFDRRFHEAFHELHFAAARREFDRWIEDPEGALALMVLLDQFPRNCFRGTAHMFATDPLARFYAHEAYSLGHDQMVAPELRVFFLLPFEHSEDLADQEISMERSVAIGGKILDYARIHRDIIVRFGRFPHRNPMLGRETTADEQAFLDGGGFAG